MKMSPEIEELITQNIIYLATSSKDGLPNAVPIGGKKVLDDSTILIIDVLLNKTKKNIIENPNVAIIAQNLNQHNPMSYQIKGTAEIHTDGKYFQQVVDLSKNFRTGSKRKKREVKSAVLVKVNDIFDNMNEGKKIE